MRPARILGILRILFGLQPECRVNVSAVDTKAPSGLFPWPIVASVSPPPESPSWPSHPRCGSHRPIEDLLLAPGLRSPPDDCREIPVAWRTTQSSIGKYVLDGDTDEDNTRGVAPAEKNSACAPPREGGWARRRRRLSLAPTRESSRSCSLSSSSPRSPRCPQQHPGSRRRRHHRRRHRSAPRSRSRHRLLRHRPPPRPEHRPPP